MQNEALEIDERAAADDAVGFGRRGYELRRQFWNDSDMTNIAGKTVIVTGGSAGVGFGAAQSLAALGAHVLIVSRDKQRGLAAVEEIKEASGNNEVQWIYSDLSSIESVHSTAEKILELCPRIDVLLNNAGGMWDQRRFSIDGYEMTWATNVLGPYLLTELLLERIIDSAPARIIEMTSGGAYSEKIELSELKGSKEEFVPKAVYSRTKRAQIIITEERAKKLSSAGIVCHVTHPGWTASPGLLESDAMASFNAKFEREFRTLEQGADTAVWLASADLPAQSTGKFWHDRAQRDTHRYAHTKETIEERDELIQTVRDSVGLKI